MGHGFGHHARHYHSMGSHHFGRHLCNCLCCFFCIGPIFFLVGFGMLVSSLTDYRTEHIVNFNAAVDTWTSTGLGTSGNYANTRNLVNISMVFDTFKYSARLPNTSAPETYYWDDDDRIQTYSQYVRFTTGAVMDMTGRCSNGPPLYGCDVSNFLTFNLYVNGTSIQQINVPAFTRTRTYVSRESQCEDGTYWDSASNTCDAYSMINAICVKLQQKGTVWSVDSSDGGSGCGLTTWQPAAYQRLRIYSAADFPTVIYVDLSVRSARDPRIAFYREMGEGALSFGMTQGAKARTGTALLVIGSIILFFLCGTCIKLLRLDKHHRHYEEVRAPGMVYQTQPVVYTPAVVYAAQPAYPQTYPPQAGYPPQQYQQPYYQGPPPNVPVAYAPTQ